MRFLHSRLKAVMLGVTCEYVTGLPLRTGTKIFGTHIYVAHVYLLTF
jgi:hypothetical protein